MSKKLQRIAAVFMAVMVTVLFVPVSVYAADEADSISYKTDAGKEVSFKGKDFNKVCDNLMDEELDYVEFTLPSTSKGKLFYDYDGSDEEAVSKSDECYYDPGKNDWDLSDISFIPKSSYSGTVTISYTGYDIDGNSFTGNVKITVGKSSSSGDLEYDVDSGDDVDFDEENFNDYCQDENGEDLDYVIFTSLPSKSKGVLYFKYDTKNEEKVSDDEKYYYDSTPSIDDLTFLADDDYSGDVTIKFEGKDVDGDSIKGSVIITVGDGGSSSNLKSAKDITYSANVGTNISFDDDDFNDVCDALTDNDIDYVKFTLPSTSNGILYYGYTTGASSSTKVSASTKYYYDEKPYIRNVTFVPNEGTAGMITLQYTGYDTDGDAFSGKIKLTYKAANTSSLYFSDVNGSYSWAVLYVDTLYSTGVLTANGSGGTTAYNPGVNITRGDYLLYLYKALNLPYNTSAGSFSDVPAGSTYYDAIASAKALGIAKGSNNVFGVNAQITREDAMVLALRAMSVSGMGYVQGDVNSLSTFTDNGKISEYAKEAIATLVKSGVITGNNNQISPKSNISRAEAAAMIYRIKF